MNPVVQWVVDRWNEEETETEKEIGRITARRTVFVRPVVTGEDRSKQNNIIFHATKA